MSKDPYKCCKNEGAAFLYWIGWVKTYLSDNGIDFDKLDQDQKDAIKLFYFQNYTPEMILDEYVRSL